MNAKAAGKAAIHCAAVAGNIPMLKAVLEFSPNLEIEVYIACYLLKHHTTLYYNAFPIKDEDGDRPLHLCAYR